MKSYDQYTDEELLLLLKQGEEGISDYLLNKYKGMVLKKAREVFLIGGETDDVIQEGMIGLFKAIRDYDPGRAASFQTFARLCVERQVYKALESAGRKKHQPLNSYVSLSEPWETEIPAPPLTEPESLVIARESRELQEQRFRSSLSSLENRVLPCYLEGMHYSDIAEKLGISPKSVDNAVRRIRKKLRTALQETASSSTDRKYP